MDSFQITMAALATSDREWAAYKIHERFVSALITDATDTIPQAFKAKADAEGAVQSTFMSFFRQQREGLVKAENWSTLFSLLAKITLRKCLNQVRELQCQKRDDGGAISFEDWHAADRNLGPAGEAMLAELKESVLRPFDSKQRAAIKAIYNGATLVEIAEINEVCPRTVQRLKEKYEKRAKKILQDS